MLGIEAQNHYYRTMLVRLIIALALLAIVPFAQAATSQPFAGERLRATLLTAEDAVAPDASTISAGLRIELRDDWKTYWRTPGDVGLAPTIDWSASENVADATMLFPAPTRFRAFGIENFGYKDEVVLPIEIALRDTGEPVRLEGEINVLVCETICVPEAFSLSLDLAVSADATIDREAGALIARFAERVPLELDGSAIAAIEGDRLVLTFKSETHVSDASVPVDVFPEFENASFGAPDLQVAPGGEVWASFPILRAPDGPGSVTLTNGSAAFSVQVPLGDVVPEVPVDARGVVAPMEDDGSSLLTVLLLAFVGGLILNVMPCVLPVLSLKLASAAKLSGETDARIRNGFLVTAAGIMAFVLVLATALLAIRGMGAAVGWGVQFQSPWFLGAVVVMLTLFALNLMGVFEFALPERIGGRLGGERRHGYGDDFATGAFAALLATPCSAPFLGTAVAFALAGSSVQLFAIFVALGLGLALPYLLVAAVPRSVRFLPKPGPWMVALRRILGVLVLGAAVWFATILATSVGGAIALVTLVLAALAAFLWRERERTLLAGVGGALLALAVLLPGLLAREPDVLLSQSQSDFVWEPFDRAAIAPAVARGEVVFVDVTADWCLTCKANKASTLDRGAVEVRLAADDVRALRADWTRPNEDIRRYLNANGRYGIPFNAVYGPAAPDGIVLSEVLTQDSVLDAIEQAKGRSAL